MGRKPCESIQLYTLYLCAQNSGYGQASSCLEPELAKIAINAVESLVDRNLVGIACCWMGLANIARVGQSSDIQSACHGSASLSAHLQMRM
jgi:hypothetical protein